MPIRFHSTLSLLLLLVPACFAGKERISILDFSVGTSARQFVNSDETQDLTQQVRDQATHYVDTSKFEIMTRENILVMLPPGRKSLGECEGQCEVEMARNLGSRWHIVGDVKKVGSKLVLSIRLYDVASGTQLGGERIDGLTVDALAEGVAAKAESLLGRIPKGRRRTDDSPKTDAKNGAARTSKVVVKFLSEPTGASVSVDGDALCVAPCSRSVDKGAHRVEASLKGYQTAAQSLNLGTNGQQVALTLVPTQVRLNLEAVDDRSGDALVADVYVDGVKVGETPFDDLVPVVAKKIEVVDGNERCEVAVALEEGSQSSATAHLHEKAKPAAAPRTAVTASAASLSSLTSTTGGNDAAPMITMPPPQPQSTSAQKETPRSQVHEEYSPHFLFGIDAGVARTFATTSASGILDNDGYGLEVAGSAEFVLDNRFAVHGDIGYLVATWSYDDWGNHTDEGGNAIDVFHDVTSQFLTFRVDGRFRILSGAFVVGGLSADVPTFVDDADNGSSSSSTVIFFNAGAGWKFSDAVSLDAMYKLPLVTDYYKQTSLSHFQLGISYIFGK